MKKYYISTGTPNNPPNPLVTVGFTGGQIHLIDPVHKELSRLYNEERLLDKTKVREQVLLTPHILP